MNDETKVNTNHADPTSDDVKKFFFAEERFIGRITTPYGVHLIKRGEAMEQARMRATQLTALLGIIQGEDSETFNAMRADLRDSIVWMALQAAQDMELLVELAVDDAKEGAA